MRLVGSVISSLLVTLCGSLQSGDLSTSEFDTLVAVPDTHGDSEAAIRSLWIAHDEINRPLGVNLDYDSFAAVFYDFIDLKRVPDEPIPGRKTGIALVQLGDLIDRGPYSQDCIHIFQGVGHILGWHTVNLYGNHELLAFTGNEEMIHPFDARKYSSLANRATQFFALTHPTFLGMARFATSAALDPEVPLNENPNTLFVHAGVEHDWVQWFANEHKLPLASMGSQIGRINAIVSDLMSDRTRADDAFGALNSILWTRSFVELSDGDLCGEAIDKLLRLFDVARIVVGHNPMADKEVNTRCDGKIILADVMMSRWMTRTDVDEEDFEGGRPVALIFRVDPITGRLISLNSFHSDLSDGSSEKVESQPLSPISVATVRPESSASSALSTSHEPVPQVLSVIEETHSAVFAKASFEGDRGFLHHFTVSSIPATIVASLLSIGGMPAIISSGPHPDGGFYLFTVTKSNQVLSEWAVRPGNAMRTTLRKKIKVLLDSIHSKGLCVGFVASVDPLSLFGVDPRGRDAVLLNWSRVRRALGESEQQIEKELLVTALSD